MAERSRRPRVRDLAIGLLAAGLLAGCAGVPTSGAIHVGRAVAPGGDSSLEGIRVLPAPPQPGMSQRALVGGFLRAAVDPEDNYSAARAFLATGTSWNTSVGTTTYNQAGLVLTRVGTNQVQMRAEGVGTISNRGDFVATQRSVVRRFTMVRQAGQWRISRPPAGVLLATADAQRSLELETVYYLNATGDSLVPDPILVSPDQPGAATTLIQALLAGPPAPLSGAVTTAVPSGTRLLGNVPVSANGVAEVNLSVLLHPISSQMLHRLAAQIVWTLNSVPDVASVQLLVDGDALVAPGFPRLQTTRTWASFDPDRPAEPRGVLYVRHGRVRGLREPAPTSLTRRAGLTAPVLDASGRSVAALSRRGQDLQLLTGATSGRLHVRVTARSITAPSFDRAGDLMVAVRSVLGSQLLELPGLGRPVVLTAPASLLDRGVSELAMSPDGARVAMIVGPPEAHSLVIGLLGHARGRPAIVGVRPVLPASDDAQGLAWSGANELVTTTSAGSGTRMVIATDTSGYNPRDLSATPFPGQPVQVAAAPGRPTYAVAAGRLYRLDGTQWRSLSTGVDPSYAG